MVVHQRAAFSEIYVKTVFFLVCLEILKFKAQLITALNNDIIQKKPYKDTCESVFLVRQLEYKLETIYRIKTANKPLLRLSSTD